MQISEIIERLERELDIKQGLFSKKIDIDNCLELLEHLKGSTKELTAEANKVLKTRTAILRNADNAAQSTIREAERHAEHKLTEGEMLLRAEHEADKIIDAAYVQSDLIVKKTKEHLDLMFRDIEEFLLSNISMIRKNREELRNINFTYTSNRFNS